MPNQYFNSDVNLKKNTDFCQLLSLDQIITSGCQTTMPFNRGAFIISLPFWHRCPRLSDINTCTTRTTCARLYKCCVCMNFVCEQEALYFREDTIFLFIKVVFSRVSLTNTIAQPIATIASLPSSRHIITS